MLSGKSVQQTGGFSRNPPHGGGFSMFSNAVIQDTWPQKENTYKIKSKGIIININRHMYLN
jgi:hypothetical protein